MREIKPDLFEKEVSRWILSKEGETKFYAGTKTVNTSKEILESILFNVLNSYYSLIRFPDRCPDCTRNGGDHDGECSMQDWLGHDYGKFE